LHVDALILTLFISLLNGTSWDSDSVRSSHTVEGQTMSECRYQNQRNALFFQYTLSQGLYNSKVNHRKQFHTWNGTKWRTIGL